MIAQKNLKDAIMNFNKSSFAGSSDCYKIVDNNESGI